MRVPVRILNNFCVLSREDRLIFMSLSHCQSLSLVMMTIDL